MSLEMIIEKVKKLTRREIADLCIDNLEQLEEKLDNINLSKYDFDKKGVNEMLSATIIIAMNTDGNVGSEEYELAKELFEILDIECYTKEGFVRLANTLVENGAGDAPKTVYNLLGIIANDADEAKELYLELLVGISLYNGVLDDEEIEMLENTFFEEGKSNNNSSTNRSSNNYLKVDEEQNIQIIRHNATLTKDDYRYYLSVGAELFNPNKSKVAKLVEVKIIVKNSSGRILETSSTTIDCIDSNSKFYFGDEFDIDHGIPSSYDIQIHCYSFVDAPENSTFEKGIQASHYNLEEDRWGDITFTANIHNGYNRNLRVSMFFVFYDSNDNITGGANTYVGTIYGNGDDNVDISLRTNATRKTVRSSASFDFLDLVD